ncbi:MAG TPA: LysM peptidoglycan-binding domain-containing protein [Bdellovibrionota bacterium]|jgi:nucleoid-associated protein YgaU
MSFPFHKFSHLFVLALLLGSYACSNTPPAGDSGNPEAGAADSSASSADAVGSVPEDMLSNEKGGQESSDSSEAAAATEPDPFSDLKEKEDEESKTADASDESGSSSAGTGEMDAYTVKAGDTLMKIAFKLYGDVDRWKDLHDINRQALKGGSNLRKGMKLRYEVPSAPFEPEQHGHSYEIKKGDTLAGIADEVYGKRNKYKKLQSYNRRLIKNPNKIFAGFTIFYDITEKEMAEAEARKAQKAAGGGGMPAPAAPVPSAIAPPQEAAPAAGPNVATTPSAADTSAVPGPGAPAAGPPAPAAQ